MNFRGFPEENCGQINSLVQLTQHVTQDLAFQENVSIPFNSGLEKNYSMPPQSFRLDELMGELQIAPPSPVADFPPSADLVRNPWEIEFQPQLQSENYQAWNEMRAQNPFPYPYEIPYEENPFCYSNFQNFPSHDFQCHEPPNFDTFYPETEYELQDEQHLEEPDEIEEWYENLITDEATSEQNDEEICRPLEPIVEFDDPQKFSNYLELQVRKHRTQKWEMKNPTKKFTEVSKEMLLDDTIRYSHIVNNSYRNHSNPYQEGCAALDEEDLRTAVLCFDETVRQNNTDIIKWCDLSYALLMRNKPVASLLAIKELLRLDPGCVWGNMTASYIYGLFDCNYQACQSIYNCLKYDAKYNFLIPEDFEMNNHSESTELERHQLEAVLRLFCKAVQQDPKEDLEFLQVAMSGLLGLIGDYEKQIDCIRVALYANPRNAGRWIDLGSALFQNGNPYGALAANMKAFEFFKSRDKDLYTIGSLNFACTDLGLVHMYLQNYREANNWFMRVITRDYDYEADGTDSLEGDYDLCMRLYLEVTDINTFL